MLTKIFRLPKDVKDKIEELNFYNKPTKYGYIGEVTLKDEWVFNYNFTHTEEFDSRDHLIFMIRHLICKND